MGVTVEQKEAGAGGVHNTYGGSDEIEFYTQQTITGHAEGETRKKNAEF